MGDWSLKKTECCGLSSVLGVLSLELSLKLGKGKRVNIYTDSAYVFGAAHVELCQWKRAGFRTSAQQPIKHEKEMKKLEALVEEYIYIYIFFLVLIF